MNISNSEKLYIYERDDKRCFYCGRDLKYGQITLDHYYPKSKGGTKEIFNLVLSCKKCNKLKGNKVPVDYETIIIMMFKRAYIDGMIKNSINWELEDQILKINRIESIKPNFVFQGDNTRFYVKDNIIKKVIFLGGRNEH